MQRNDDLLRRILLEWEASDDWMHESYTTSSSTPDEEEWHYHVLLLEDAGLVTSVGRTTYRITADGHGFLSNTRKSETWETVKEQAGKLPGFGIGLLAKIAEALAVQKAREFGVPI